MPTRLPDGALSDVTRVVDLQGNGVTCPATVRANRYPRHASMHVNGLLELVVRFLSKGELQPTGRTDTPRVEHALVCHLSVSRVCPRVSPQQLPHRDFATRVLGFQRRRHSVRLPLPAPRNAAECPERCDRKVTGICQSIFQLLTDEPADGTIAARVERHAQPPKHVRPNRPMLAGQGRACPQGR
eukprot:scaffold106042_cov42-Prasinocladus_malaysianus.AAC.3